MLTADQIAALGDAAEKIISPISDYLIKDIALRISEAGQLTSTAAYEVWRLQNMGMSQRQIKKRLKKFLGVTEKELKQLLTQAAEVGYNFDLENLPHTHAVPFKKNSALQNIVKAAVEMAQDDLSNMVQTIGFVNQDGVCRPLTEAYQQASDFAFQKVVTGAQDYNSAVREATRELLKKGIRTIDYESGVHTSIEAAVRRNVLGGLGLMQEKISQYTHDELGCDGWEISAHGASAPDHEPIQGKQYSDKEYEKLNNSLLRRIGTLNCGHSAHPIILGVNSPQYSPEELEKMRQDNEKGIDYEGKHYTMYEATQRQRKLERSIRNQKRRILVDEAIGDEDRLPIDQTKLVRLQDEYARFSKAAGLRSQAERANILEFGPRQMKAAEKAAEEMENALEKQRRYDTMINEIRTVGNIPKAATISVPARDMDLVSLGFDDVHINVERVHKVTREQAERWVKESRLSVTVWKGRFERYYSNDGAVYIDTVEKTIRTAFSAREYGESIIAMLEVLNKNGY